MERTKELERFYQNLSQEIINKAAIEEEGQYRESIFTQIYIDYLCEWDELVDGNLSYYEGRGVKINGFSLSEDETSIVLFVSLYKNSPGIFSVPPSEAVTMLNRVKQFYLKARKGLYTEIEEALEGYDIAKTIYDLRDKITSVKLLLFTNGTIRATVLPVVVSDGVSFVSAVWDLERIYRISTSGNAREKIDFSLKEIAGKNLDCIKVDIPDTYRTAPNGEQSHSGGYTSYLTVFPGDVLYKIYEKYNSRLLEKNVRAFLQVRGNVNRGIRDTILQIPEMFLAYNNGISATAESVSVTNVHGSICTITALKDFQIVNGGQTTASIFNACLKNKTPLNKIYVQAKITVVKDQNEMEKVVPQISKCANTQNKVQLADFSANDGYHQAIEKLSRTVWAPAKTGGEQQTKWFYERARGQYNDTRAREKNKKYFDSIYPKTQYFDKLELARYENVWDMLPYIASKGGQTSFREFTVRLQKKMTRFIPGQTYYQELIAKAILYRETKAIIRKMRLKGYWANVADYTFAYLSFKSSQRIDLAKIWKNQGISDSLKRNIEMTADAVHRYIIESANGQNVTQWCKKEACWTGLKQLEINGSKIAESDLTSSSGAITKTFTAAGGTKRITEASSEEDRLIADIQRVDGKIWNDIASWGKESGELPAFQCSIAQTLSRFSSWHKKPSWRQARQGIKMLNTANKYGFSLDSQIKVLIGKYEDVIKG